MPVSRNRFALLFAAVLLATQVAWAQAKAPTGSDKEANSPSSTDSDATSPTPQGTPGRPTGSKAVTNGAVTPAEREEIRREVLEEVRRELEKTQGEILDKVSFVESEADARNYDAATLKELKQTVNLLQLHGYFRTRGDVFAKADLGRGPDPQNYTLFPISGGNPNEGGMLGTGNMRLRLNPVLRISDFIAIKGQIDLLDNVLFGGAPLLTQNNLWNSADVLANRVLPGVALGPNFINVKRVWAEIRTPVGELAFGRMGFHWGEGFFYNDGNCFDCDYGNTFDRLELTTGPFVGHHLTLAADMLGQGASTLNLVPNGNLETEAYGRPIALKQLAGAYRFSLAVQKQLRDVELRRKLENNEWALQYGLLLGYRTQNAITVPSENAAPTGNLNITTQRLDGRFGEGDLFFQARRGKLRLAVELSIFGGQIQNNPLALGTSLQFLTGGGVLRGQHFFLKQDSLSVGVDVGFASGDKTPGMGVRTFRGRTTEGSIDGLQFNCTGPSFCPNKDITNFLVNPDFRVDELLWRNIFTQITDAYFVRGEVRFKPGGRASGGAEDYGLDLFGRAIYSQAIYGSSTPSGTSTPLGIELNAGAIFTTKDGFIAGLSAAFLFPLSGLNNNNLNGTGATLDASSAQLYRGWLGVQF